MHSNNFCHILLVVMFGNIDHKDDADWLKLCMKMEFEGTQQKGHPRKTLWDLSKGIWRVLIRPVRMLRIGIIRD